MDPVIIFFLIFIGFCLFMFFYTSSIKSKAKKNINKIKEEKNANLIISLTHFYGLPVAENTITQILSTPTEYEFIANNTSFKLRKQKVTDVTITTDVEIQKNNVSSIGGAIGGGLLFGPVGAMIGGRSKEKTSKIVNYYLIFTYFDNNEIKYLSFNCTNNLSAYKFTKEFNNTKDNSTNNIEL